MSITTRRELQVPFDAVIAQLPEALKSEGFGVLTEIDYALRRAPSGELPFDQAEERFSMYMLKAYALPELYWKGMLRGRA